jgi:CheY-like chemotaxis protein
LEIQTAQSNFDTAEPESFGPGVLRARVPLVLLVGDDEAAVRLCAERLQGASLRVATARTGFEAIVKACWHMPDLIAMQDGLEASEGVNGTVAAQLIRICPVTSHIPVVACALTEPDILAHIERELVS